jgi:arginase
MSTCRILTSRSGDCTTALGAVAGLQHAGIDPGIVWLDAHGDAQTLETTASGYLGGLPLRLLVGYRPGLIGVHLDVDVIDPGAVPGHAAAAAGGSHLSAVMGR